MHIKTKALIFDNNLTFILDKEKQIIIVLHTNDLLLHNLLTFLDYPFADMESSQAKQVMSELEKSMHGLDDENPDPRQMGSMMRKICEMTGEKVDEPMEEILRKLEEGVSPDQIEENMGSVLDENENLPEGNIESEKDAREEKKIKR